MIVAEVNTMGITLSVIARISCVDWKTLMEYLRQHDFLANPMTISRRDDMWSVEVYERP